MSQYYIYMHEKDTVETTKPAFEISSYCLKDRLFSEGEEKSFRTKIGRIYFLIITRGKGKIYCARVNGKVAHTAYVIPKCYKFPFLGKKECEIGPCMTYTEFRGRGIYPAVLKTITRECGYEKYYMLVEEQNASSIKGIEKAGFVREGKACRTRYTKRYLYESRGECHE